MRKLNLLYAAGLLAGIAFSGTAQAAVVVSFAPGAASPGAGQSVIYNFDTTIPAGILGPLVKILAPPNTSEGAAPANSVPYGTHYLSVLTGGSATINFLNAVSQFSFDWGSVDAFNTLTLHTTSGDIVKTGSDFSNPADGNQGANATNGLLTAIGNGALFTGFTLTSSGNSFEIDNVAFPVPEASTWAMMLFGFGFIGYGMRRRRKPQPKVRFAF